ncbi:hypothetical protein [Streptomyces sp. A1547]|uniref:hypothetical protein n=1 Tax=Streptomyces sp. A1547 TaxID=2563105 RepID=UPI001F0F5AAF|nr:hypothetical protein [Streptomyces sp. A1547]
MTTFTWQSTCTHPVACKRFGKQAGKLVAAVPMQLAKAHSKAQATHRTAELKKRSPYGVTLAEAVRENLADMARELHESIRDVRGYEYAVINDHALFPFRYADKPRRVDRARLPANTSPTRRRLFRAHGPQPPEALFDLREDLTTHEYLGLHDAFEELGATTKLVCLFFTADAESGIHVIHWGQAHLEPDRTFTWLYREQLPLARAARAMNFLCPLRARWSGHRGDGGNNGDGPRAPQVSGLPGRRPGGYTIFQTSAPETVMIPMVEAHSQIWRSLVADYAAHAHKAQELLDASEKWAKGRLSADQLIASAQVEALLALAAAVAHRDDTVGVPSGT